MADTLVPNLNFGITNTNWTASSLVPLPPKGQLLLITDHLAASAEFVLHRALHLGLGLNTLVENENIRLQSKPEPKPKPRVVLVSLARDLAHWRTIASKAGSGVNLTRHLKAGTLVFVDGLGISAYNTTKLNERLGVAMDSDDTEVGCVKCPPLFLVDGHGHGHGHGHGVETVKPSPSLKGLYDVIRRALLGPLSKEKEKEAETETDLSALEPVVIIDDISILSFIGISETAITRFIRALRALCCRHSAGLIIRAHATAAYGNTEFMPFTSDILRMLIEASHRHVEVRPLASGRSGAISGEVAVHFGGLGVGINSSDDAGDKLGRGTAVHYRLSDTGATFFQKGMSTGIL